LICNRISPAILTSDIPRDIKYLICEYICTK
ncbi:unnamed protein product, partial [marine sediment metagenome]